MFGKDLPGKPFWGVSLEASPFFSGFGISFDYFLLEICQAESNDVFGPAAV